MFLRTVEFCSMYCISFGISSTIPWTEMDPSGLVVTEVPGGSTLSPTEIVPSGFFVTLVPAGSDAGDPEPKGIMCICINVNVSWDL